MSDILDFNKNKEKEKGCVDRDCHHVFKSENGNTVCVANPPAAVPIPQIDQFTHQPIITIQPVFPPCVTDTVCGRYLPKM